MEVGSTDGVTVAVHDLGGDGDPFLICHATGFLGQVYRALAAELADHFHVFALDFRGHGDSTAPAGDRFHWTGMTDDLDAAVAGITDEPIDLFGHSLGGGVAMLLEERRPGTLRSAYLFEPIVVPVDFDGPPRPEGEDPMSSAARRRRSAFASRAEALLRYASRPPLDELRAGTLADYIEYGFRERADGWVELKCTPEHEALTFEADGKPTYHTVAAITTPIVVAIGTRARGWTPAMFGPQLVDHLQHGRLDEHPMLGHFGPLQDPVSIARSILAGRNA